MTRLELTNLGKKIINCEGSEEEINLMYDLFSKNVPHPNGANLFFILKIIMLEIIIFQNIILP
jgi:hypothetical protein